jgi:phage repressor protein C with HTH and peptisase S24 domain
MYTVSQLLNNDDMKTIEEIHRENLQALAKEFDGVVGAASRIGISSSQYSQWLNGSQNSGTGKPRGMRASSVRRIEKACGKPSGWMDRPHAEQIDTQKAAHPGAAKKTEVIEIPQYTEIGGGMGGGITLRDQPGAIHGWRVTPEWISKNIRSHSGAGNLCVVTGFGNSMQPLYNPGDPLIIDRGVKSVEADATYFFRVGDEGFIKILQRIPGEGIRVISKNKDYETWTIKPGMDFEVFGQVLKAWCGTDV